MKLKPLAALLLGASSVFAETQTLQEPVVVTATRTPQSLASSLLPTTVITRDDIEQSGNVSIAELLQSLAGVEIRETGGTGQPAGIFMRGAGSQHTLVLVDGVRLASVTTGATALEHIPLGAIERIEVVNGPLSGLYGSDAIGGVVQIFTRRSDKPVLSADIGIGNRSTRQSNAGFSAVEGNTSASLHAGFKSVDATSAINATAGPYLFNADRDPYRNRYLTVHLAHKLWQGETLAFSAFASEGKTHFDAGPGSDDRNVQKISGIKASSSNQILPGWHSRIEIARGVDELQYIGNIVDRFRTQQNQAAWLNDFATPLGAVLAGVERLDQHLDSSVAYVKPGRTTNAAFAGLNETLGTQRLSASVRSDQDEQYGKRNTGSISYGITTSPGSTWHISQGRAFHAPSFNDLYYPAFDLGAGLVIPASNPDLRPEISTSRELGFRHSDRGEGFGATLFDNRIRDLIVFTDVPSNVQNARIRGIEASLDVMWLGFNIRATATRQRPRDEDTGRRLRSRAEAFGTLRATRTFGAWQASASLVANGARFDSSSEAQGSRMGGYALVNTQVRYALDKHWSMDLSGNNLAARKYELAQGYNTPGRSVFLNLRFEAR